MTAAEGRSRTPTCPAPCARCGCRSACPCVSGDPLCDSCNTSRCAVCASTQHTSEAHLRRVDPAVLREHLLATSPCVVHIACIGKVTCQDHAAPSDIADAASEQTP